MNDERREMLKQVIIDCIDNKTKDKDMIYTINYICGYLKGLKDSYIQGMEDGKRDELKNNLKVIKGGN